MVKRKFYRGPIQHAQISGRFLTTERSKQWTWSGTQSSKHNSGGVTRSEAVQQARAHCVGRVGGQRGPREAPVVPVHVLPRREGQGPLVRSPHIHESEPSLRAEQLNSFKIFLKVLNCWFFNLHYRQVLNFFLFKNGKKLDRMRLNSF